MKKRLLYIARNIPTPKQKSNNVILRIAHKLTKHFDIDFLFPKEIVPWGVHLLDKYKPLSNLSDWKVDNLTIKILKYIRLPIDSNAFIFSNTNQINLNHKYDLIHAHLIFPDGIFAYHYSHQFKIPYIITIRKSDVELLRRVRQSSHTWVLAKKILQNASSVLGLNLATISFIKDNFEIQGKLLPHGIDSSIIIKKASLIEDERTIKITVVAEAIATKQIDWVIQAVQNYDGDKPIQLTIIGDGKEMDNLKSLANNNPKIIFLGKVKHDTVLRELTDSHIFALPSCSESFGLVYLEAAARYNAIIGYRNTGIFGVLKEHEEILYIDNFIDFSTQLFRLIEDKTIRENLSSNAFEKVKSLTWAKIELQYLKIYNNHIDSKN